MSCKSCRKKRVKSCKSDKVISYSVPTAMEPQQGFLYLQSGVEDPIILNSDIIFTTSLLNTDGVTITNGGNYILSFNIPSGNNISSDAQLTFTITPPSGPAQQATVSVPQIMPPAIVSITKLYATIPAGSIVSLAVTSGSITINPMFGGNGPIFTVMGLF